MGFKIDLFHFNNFRGFNCTVTCEEFNFDFVQNLDEKEDLILYHQEEEEHKTIKHVDEFTSEELVQ